MKIDGVRSLPEFVERIGEIRRSWRDNGLWVEPWFRGQRNAEWPLLPNLFRNEEEFDLFAEYNLRDDFERKGIQLVTGARIPQDKWEWYFTLQHYRGRTRLLDWTDAGLVALYFAIEHVASNVHPIVWALDPSWFNLQNIKYDSVLSHDWKEAEAYLPDLYEDTRLPRQPVAIDPPHVTARFSVQHSHFTLHGSAAVDLRLMSTASGSRLVPIRIEHKALTEIRRDLQVCGVVETSIYPDLEGLARELSSAWATEWIYEERRPTRKRGLRRRPK